MNYALIGCGRIATNHITAAQRNNLNLVGICDLSSMAMERILSKHDLNNNNTICCYTDYKKLIAEHPELDLIAIATESGEHARIALDCIDAGINTIVEKPIAMSMKDANEIVQRGIARGVKVAACHQNRFNVAVQKMRQSLEAGRFGVISHGSIHVRWNRNRSYYEQASWRGTWEQDGGCLMNQCIHGIDLLRWMMGDEPIEVYGHTARRQHQYLEAEDVGLAVIKFSNGALATVEGTVNVYPKNLEETLFLFGESGTVKIGGTSTNNLDIWDFADEQDGDDANRGLKEATSNVYGNGHSALYSDMIDAILTDRKPYVDAVAGRNALEIVLAIYKSQKSGMPVRLPLDDFSTSEMLGYFDD